MENILLQLVNKFLPELEKQQLTGNPYPIKGWFIYGTNLIAGITE